MRCPTLVLIGFVASCAWLLVSQSLGSMHYWDCSLLGLLPYGLDAFNGFVASCGQSFIRFDALLGSYSSLLGLLPYGLATYWGCHIMWLVINKFDALLGSQLIGFVAYLESVVCGDFRSIFLYVFDAIRMNALPTSPFIIQPKLEEKGCFVFPEKTLQGFVNLAYFQNSV